MASTVSTPYSRGEPVVLPSIHEMFPQHFLPRSAVRAPIASISALAPMPGRGTHSLPAPADPRFHPPNNGNIRAQSASVYRGTEMEAVDSKDGKVGAKKIKKYPCRKCGKRFKRFASLNVHLKIHTGATSFHCPHPSCGRAFNVKSNMTRHFLKHEKSIFINSDPHSYAATTTPPMPRPSLPPLIFVPVRGCKVSEDAQL